MNYQNKIIFETFNKPLKNVKKPENAKKLTFFFLTRRDFKKPDLWKNLSPKRQHDNPV